MPAFDYSARNEKGDLVQGSIEAVSTHAARSQIAAQGLSVEQVHEKTVSSPKDFAKESRNYGVWESSGPPAVVSNVPPADEDVALAEPRVEAESDSFVYGSKSGGYFPIARTAALYAGWLLAYYCVVYALGWYQQTRSLPFEIPYVQALLYSSLVLGFSFAAFLFLLFSHAHRAMGGGTLRGVLIAILGTLIFAGYMMNIV